MSTTYGTPVEWVDEPVDGQAMLNKLAAIRASLFNPRMAGGIGTTDQRARLIFYGCIAMRLRMRLAEGPLAHTMPSNFGTDGKHIWVNPAYGHNGKCPKFTNAQLRGIVLHEVIHNTELFFERVRGKNKPLYNIAHDLRINDMINSGEYGPPEYVSLPDFGCFPGGRGFEDFPPGLSTDEYYKLLLENREEMKEEIEGLDLDCLEPCDGNGKPLTGEARERALGEIRQSVRQAVAEAANVTTRRMGRGNLPGDLMALIDAALEPKVRWQDQLANWMTARDKSDYVWTKPNPRLLWTGYGFPSLDKPALGTGAILLDTSGSMSDKTIAACLGEVCAIIEMMPSPAWLVQHDYTVKRYDELDPRDPPTTFEVRGRGGTSHVPVFEWIEENKTELELQWVIVMSDMGTTFPTEDPGIPVLWMGIESGDFDVPFGDKIIVEEDEYE